MFAALPKRVQELAEAAYELFVENPAHPSLQHHELKDTKRGRHKKGSCVVHISYRWCAIYVPEGEVNLWYWIGIHEDYNNFVGLK